MTPKISVIVPVYKAEAYLHRCLDSLFAQTFTDYEVLLVDDGSPDHSGEICDAYAARDSRIKVFHKENGGVSSARQYGMERAQGEYTIHADPDDWMEPDMLAELYREAIEENADMVICDFFENKKDEELYRVQKPSSLEPDVVLRQLLGQQLLGACWNKLLRRQLVQDFGIRFPLDVILWEDLLVNCLFLTHEVKVAYLPKAFYHYDRYTNAGSLTQIPNERVVQNLVRFISYMESNLDTSAYAPELKKIKCIAKENAFRSFRYSKKDFLQLYPEVNQEYKYYQSSSTSVALCLRLALAGFYRIAQITYRLWLLFKKN